MKISSSVARRTMLLLSLLISGGNLIFPRPLFLLVIIAIYFLYFRGHIKIRKALIPVGLFMVFLVLFGFFHPVSNDIVSVVIRFANFFAAFILLNIYLRESISVFKTDVYALLKYMPMQAILTVILAFVAPFLFVHISFDAVQFNTFLGIFNYHTTIETSGLIRPNGFFFEPGVFQFYLNLLLYLCLFEFKNKRLSILTVLALILTKSSTGLVIMTAILALYFFKTYMFNGNLVTRIFRFLVAVIFITGVGIIAASNVYEKMTGDAKGSFLARQYDTITGINVVREYPYLGIGFDYNAYYKASRTLGYRDTSYFGDRVKNRDNTNGIIVMAYSVGIPLGLIFLLGLLRQQMIKHKLVGAFLIFVSLLTESLFFTPFFLLFVFSGLTPRAKTIYMRNT